LALKALCSYMVCSYKKMCITIFRNLCDVIW